MEALLLSMDKTDRDNNDGHYLQSRHLDVERENDIPRAWQGQSRVQLIEELEKLALEYGECNPQPDIEPLIDMSVSGIASQGPAAQSFRQAVKQRLSQCTALHGE